MISINEAYIYDDEEYGSVPLSSATMYSSSPSRDDILGQLIQEQCQHSSRTFPEWIKYLVDLFIIRRTNGSVQWWLDIYIYGRTIFINIFSEGYIGWKSGDKLLYKQIHFTIGNFRGFVHRLVGQIQQQLVHELMFCGNQKSPAIPWDYLYDNVIQSTAG